MLQEKKRAFTATFMTFHQFFIQPGRNAPTFYASPFMYFICSLLNGVTNKRMVMAHSATACQITMHSWGSMESRRDRTQSKDPIMCLMSLLILWQKCQFWWQKCLFWCPSNLTMADHEQRKCIMFHSRLMVLSYMMGRWTCQRLRICHHGRIYSRMFMTAKHLFWIILQRQNMCNQ